MVELLDGYTYHVLARFNGKNRPPHTFNISLDFVILYFFSDEINQAQGFAIRYKGKKLPLLFLHFNMLLKHVICTGDFWSGKKKIKPHVHKFLMHLIATVQ